MSQTQVGFVGVGLMGHGMAKNILGGGYPITVIAHRNRVPVEDLVSQGATEASSLESLAAASDIIHICAPGSPQVEAIVDTMLPHLKNGAIIVDCSTSDPTSTEKLAERLADKGCAMVDAPLGGTPVQAMAGELSTMVGASDDAFARVKPVLACWAQAIVHLGKPGIGHKMKLLNNFLSLGYGALYAEALALSRKVGISVEQFDSVIRGSRMDCGFYQTFMGYAVEGNCEAHKFALSNAYKDMRYLASMADAASVANPVGTAVKNSMALAVNTGGDGPEDYVPHLVDFVARANGLQKDK
ncbi:NAD(P)-dependent oxidoreductase [Ruegeria sp. 2205SS24-7]|uniref:NAD(P)-dependent oxidoreductase n=1 Tax=Ruegeria discodermiae TaxID=3064389 RepID=UPI00274158D4|nr:NAD(P)-dependent oxidoreductase [Ruegeria sp. 2205SS24-7]MDP5221003.1 NAD(P)-dependent oxidoreductase [Ruegeria sp. 2205SS24-7]